MRKNIEHFNEEHLLREKEEKPAEPKPEKKAAKTKKNSSRK